MSGFLLNESLQPSDTDEKRFPITSQMLKLIPNLEDDDPEADDTDNGKDEEPEHQETPEANDDAEESTSTISVIPT